MRRDQQLVGLIKRGLAATEDDQAQLQAALDQIINVHVDAIAFGKAFISNPDLPRRLQLDAPLNEWKAETFYAPAEEGYTDYPALA